MGNVSLIKTNVKKIFFLSFRHRKNDFCWNIYKN